MRCLKQSFVKQQSWGLENVVHTGDLLGPLFDITVIVFPIFFGVGVSFVECLGDKERFVEVASLPIWVQSGELLVSFCEKIHVAVDNLFYIM